MTEQSPTLDGVTAGDIRSLPLSPYFRAWAERKLQTGELQTLVDAIAASGRAETANEALILMHELSQNLSRQRFITLSDFSNGTNGAVGKLRKLLAEMYGETIEQAKDNFLYRQHGIIGHVMIPKLLSGELMYGASVDQLNIFAKKEKLDPESRAYDSRVVFELRDVLRRTQKAVIKKRQNENPTTDYADELNALEKVLQPIFADGITALKSLSTTPNRDHILLLTLMSWAGAVSEFWRDNRILFKEIRTLGPRFGASGGRIDAVEIIVDHDLPVSRRRKIERAIRSMTMKHRFNSVGHLLIYLTQMFGRTFSAIIHDWKFAVGDGTSKRGVINDSYVAKQPLKPHVYQIERYITLTSLDYSFYLSELGISIEKNLWRNDWCVRGGELTYFLPYLSPVRHTVQLETREKTAVFIRDIVSQWHTAGKRAVDRQLTNHVARTASKLIDDKKKNGEANTSQLVIDAPVSVAAKVVRPAIEGVIDRYRKFLDADKLIEIIRERGAKQLIMHVARLREKVKDKTIFSQDFGEHGGYIMCPSPKHTALDGMMWVKLTGGHVDGLFKCLGQSCGIEGKLSPHS